jgi:DNA-binding transcriptional ArsR family regulator
MMDRRLIELVSDPERLKALTLLNERSAGVGEVAAQLEIEPAAAGRLLNAMHDDGLIELVGEALSRGAVEPHYRAAVRVLWDDEEWAALGDDEQKRMTAWILGMIDADVREAIESGTYTARHDSHASRSVTMVDEQGWDELQRIHADALDAVLAVRAASAERLAEAGEAGFPVLSAMLCCELPAQRSPAD